jgi:hypothetical protein
MSEVADYRGMSYQEASREASRLIENAHRRGRWHDLPEKLSALRGVMFAYVQCGTVDSQPPRCRRPPVDLRKFTLDGRCGNWMSR